MTDLAAAERALDRVARIKWAFDDRQTRTYLHHVKAFLERARSATAQLGAAGRYPFFDVCELAGLEARLPVDLEQRLADCEALHEIPRHHVPDVCRWYVRAAFLRDELEAVGIDGEAIYEPLMTLFDSGGDFTLDHGFIQVGIAGVPFVRPQGS